MSKYNLDTLGHAKFERLRQNLVQRIIGSLSKVYDSSDNSRESNFHDMVRCPLKKNMEEGDEQ